MIEGPGKSQILDDDFAESERLFHYTSANGLYGILEAECFWSTHFKFLNDSNEFFAAERFISDFVFRELHRKMAALKVSQLIEIKDGISLRDLCQDEAKTIVRIFYDALLQLGAPFIFSSFVSSPADKSFRNGLLLHWATYGRNGGYALEINPHKLSTLMAQERDEAGLMMISQKASYLDEGIPSELKDDFRVIGDVATDMAIERLENKKVDPVRINRAGSALVRLASVIKDDYFKDERESRLVAMRYKSGHQDVKLPSIKVRQKGSSAIPYIKLFENRLFGDNCPIEAIIVGPHPERVRRKEALELYLDGKGLERIEVIQSEVPYLGG